MGAKKAGAHSYSNFALSDFLRQGSWLNLFEHKGGKKVVPVFMMAALTKLNHRDKNQYFICLMQTQLNCFLIHKEPVI